MRITRADSTYAAERAVSPGSCHSHKMSNSQLVRLGTKRSKSPKCEHHAAYRQAFPIWALQTIYKKKNTVFGNPVNLIPFSPQTQSHKSRSSNPLALAGIRLAALGRQSALGAQSWGRRHQPPRAHHSSFRSNSSSWRCCAIWLKGRPYVAQCAWS